MSVHSGIDYVPPCTLVIKHGDTRAVRPVVAPYVAAAANSRTNRDESVDVMPHKSAAFQMNNQYIQSLFLAGSLEMYEHSARVFGDRGSFLKSLRYVLRQL